MSRKTEAVNRPRLRPGALAVPAAPLALWGLALLIVRPGGDFPLNDDWIYAAAVQNWLETGQYSGHPFSTASLVAQAGWGAFFCTLFGFSFTVLRWSTLLLWAVAACTTTALARRLGASRWMAALAGCLVIANPLAMNLGYTFMTDVPFMALSAFAAYGYVRSIEDGQVRWLVFGSVFGVLAVWVRQFGLILPVAYLFACGMAWRRWRGLGVQHVAAFAVPWLVGIIVLARLPGNPEALGHFWLPQYLGENPAAQILGSVVFYAESLVYLGLFSVPLALAGMVAWFKPEHGISMRWHGVWLTTAAALIGITCAVPPRRLPYLGNILYDLGLGPMNVRGNMLPSGELWTPHTWSAGWWMATALGIVVAGWTVAASMRWMVQGSAEASSGAHRQSRWFLGIWAALAVVALYQPWLPVRFDRYLLGALVPTLVLVASTSGVAGHAFANGSERHHGGATGPVANKGLRAVQLGLVALMFIFSLRAQHDYLAWNRARWHALNDLMAEGIPPEQIDGGYEFNGWYTSPHFIAEHGAGAFVDSGPKGWWVVEDTYAIAWRPRPGYTVRERIPYDSWLGQDPELLVLERQ